MSDRQRKVHSTTDWQVTTVTQRAVTSSAARPGTCLSPCAVTFIPRQSAREARAPTRRGEPYVDDRDWSRLVDQLQAGDCTPFLGAGACHGTLPSGHELSQIWATDYGYPFVDHHDLPRVMQYAAISMRDHVTVKQQVARTLTGMSCPDFTNGAEPHGLLASFPLPVYLTTNYDDFMVSALRLAGKRPLAAVCPWYDQAPRDARLATDDEFVPHAGEPIVYHLHGSWQEPRSLVLTEEDYLEFLINLAMDHASDGQRLIPTSILPSLTARPLLFVGYSLQDWTFRVIFHGLRRTVAGVQQRRHVSVQLPPPATADPNVRERAEQYLNAYFEKWNISIFWGTAQDFCIELRNRLGRAS